MSYRDELEAAHQRINALEKQLVQEKQSVALTTANNANQLAIASKQKTAQRLLGAPTRYKFQRVIEGSIDESCYAELIQCMADGFDHIGQSSIVPNRLDWTTQSSSQSGAMDNYSISITNLNGQVTIRGQVQLIGLAGGIFGGIGGGVGLGTAFAPGLLFLVNPLLGAAAITTWLGGTYVTCRKLFRSSSRKRQAKLEAVLNALERIVTRSLRAN